MNLLLTTGLLLAAAPLAVMPPAAAERPATDHVVRIDHRSGAVDAHYRGTVAVDHRQVGAVLPGGRGSTLRCAWRADLVVHREARGTSGLGASRRFGQEGVLTGSRPGWCDAVRHGIADDVASRAGEIDRHLRALAREDHRPLRAELDRLHAARATG